MKETIAAFVAGGILLLAVLVLTVSLLRLVREARALARAAQRALAITEEQLPAMLAEMRQTSANVNRLSADLAPRLQRVDRLLDEAELSLASLRATVESAEDIVRGPVAAVERAKRTVRAAGEGLARGAEMLRRGVEERIEGNQP